MQNTLAVTLSTDSNAATTVVTTSGQLDAHREVDAVSTQGQMGINLVPLIIFFVIFAAAVYKLYKFK